MPEKLAEMSLRAAYAALLPQHALKIAQVPTGVIQVAMNGLRYYHAPAILA